MVLRSLYTSSSAAGERDHCVHGHHENGIFLQAKGSALASGDLGKERVIIHETSRVSPTRSLTGGFFVSIYRGFASVMSRVRQHFEGIVSDLRVCLSLPQKIMGRMRKERVRDRTAKTCFAGMGQSRRHRCKHV